MFLKLLGSVLVKVTHRLGKEDLRLKQTTDQDYWFVLRQIMENMNKEADFDLMSCETYTSRKMDTATNVRM